MSSTPSSTINEEKKLLLINHNKYKSYLKRILYLKAIFPNGEYAEIFNYCEKSQKVTCRLCCIEMECRDILNHITWQDHLKKVNHYRTFYTNESTKKLIRFLNSLNTENPQMREVQYLLVGYMINSIARLKKDVKMSRLPPRYLDEYKKFINEPKGKFKGNKKDKSFWYKEWPTWIKNTLHAEVEQYKLGLQKKYKLAFAPSLKLRPFNLFKCYKTTAASITHPVLLKYKILLENVPKESVSNETVSFQEQSKEMVANTEENKITINNDKQQDFSNALVNITCEKQSENKTEVEVKDNKVTVTKNNTEKVKDVVNDKKQNSSDTVLKSILKNKIEPAKNVTEANKLSTDKKPDPQPPVLKSILKKKSEPISYTSTKLNNEKIQVLQFVDDDEDDYCIGLIQNEVTSDVCQNKSAVTNQNNAIEDSDVVPHKKIKLNLLNKAKPNIKNVNNVESIDIEDSDGVYVEKPKRDQVISLIPKQNTRTSNIFENFKKSGHSSSIITNRFFRGQTNYKDNKSSFSKNTFTTYNSIPNCLMFADDEDM